MGSKMKIKKILSKFLELKTIILSVLTPIVLLPILYNIDGDAGRCAYGICILVIFWVFEVFPLPVTSLLPAVIFPALGVLSGVKICEQYFKDVTLSVIGIFGMVAAVEKWGLHKRVAVRILMLFGTKPHWLILGMLVSTSVLSMFIAAGVAVLMLPIVRSMVDKLRNVEVVDDTDVELKEIHNDVDNVEEIETEEESNKSHEEEIDQLYKALALCIAYGTTLGSSATLTGAPSNFVMVQLTEEYYRTYGLSSPVTFISWMVMAFPVIVLIVFLNWIWFVILFLRGKGLFRRATVTDAMKKAEARVKEHIQEEYKSLGPWTYPEVMALFFLCLLVVFFITKDLYFAPGWDSLFKPGFVTSSAPACLLIVLLFIVPAKSPWELFRGETTGDSESKVSRFAPLVTWADVERTLPWGILLLLGAAFSLVEASRVSGMTKLLGTYFEEFSSLEPWLMTLIITGLTTFLTEFISNSATITMLLPIVARLAIISGFEPLGLIFPLTLSAKFAFMMPIATPPNALAYSLGALKIKDMAVAGFGLNLLSIITVNVGAQTWGKAYFHWDVIPEAMRINNTLITSNITALS